MTSLRGLCPRYCVQATQLILKKCCSAGEPLTILSCFSKFLERLIHSRFTKFFSQHKVIYEAQYRFQKNISTVHAAVLDIVSCAFTNINENHFTGLTLLDLQKAFDTVPHDILLAKLERYGIRGPAPSLIQYFLNREQFVCINGELFLSNLQL